jgi:hypothetical protein
LTDKEGKMKIRIGVIFLVILVIVLVPIAVFAQTPTPEATNSTGIVAELGTGDFWWTLLVTLAAGAAGGVVYELLMLQGNIEKHHKPKPGEVTEKNIYANPDFMYDLGIWARIIIGALAAVAALFVLSPSTAFGLVATAIIAGSAGTAVFRSLQDRLSTALAQQETAAAKEGVQVVKEKTDQAKLLLEELKNKLTNAPSGGTVVAHGIQPQFAARDLSDFDKIRDLLSEAKGVQEKVLGIKK